ncbi:MAG: nucleotidyltransferase domain-containing protein [Pyrinomonadaceae bacterium]
MDVQVHIRAVCDQIVRGFNPEKIILFGSYALGAENEDSDIDLLVIMPYEGNELEKMAEVRGVLSSEMPLDVLVKTPTQVQQRLAAGDFFVREIIESGRILYDAGNLGLDK